MISQLCSNVIGQEVKGLPRHERCEREEMFSSAPIATATRYGSGGRGYPVSVLTLMKERYLFVMTGI